MVGFSLPDRNIVGVQGRGFREVGRYFKPTLSKHIFNRHALLLGQKGCNYLTGAMADQSPSDAGSSQGETVDDNVQEEKAVRFSPEEEAVSLTNSLSPSP